MGGKSDAPEQPNYKKAAEATAQGNLEAARVGAAANRVNQYNPYGSMVYSRVPGGGPDDWQSSVSLSPAGQALLDQQNRTSLGMGSLQDSAMARVAQQQRKPFDYSSVGSVQDAAQKSVTDRLDPMWKANSESQQAMLANQGLQPGTQAYDNAMRSFNNSKNDAYQQAVMAGINTMPQTLQMATSLRNQPLNELNAIRSGGQVQNPTFQTAPQQATTGGANYLGAAQAEGQGSMAGYNASTGNSNAMMGGLFNLGSSIFGGAGSAGGFGKLFGF
jgi:hypothetical protein